MRVTKSGLSHSLRPPDSTLVPGVAASRGSLLLRIAS